jgi:hypothetical protein
MRVCCLSSLGGTKEVSAAGVPATAPGLSCASIAAY